MSGPSLHEDAINGQSYVDSAYQINKKKMVQRHCDYNQKANRLHVTYNVPHILGCHPYCLSEIWATVFKWMRKFAGPHRRGSTHPSFPGRPITSRSTK